MYNLIFSMTRESEDVCEKTISILEDKDGKEIPAKEAIAEHMSSVGLWVASQVLPHDGFASFSVKDQDGKVIHGPVYQMSFMISSGDRRAD